MKRQAKGSPGSPFLHYNLFLTSNFITLGFYPYYMGYTIPWTWVEYDLGIPPPWSPETHMCLIHKMHLFHLNSSNPFQLQCWIQLLIHWFPQLDRDNTRNTVHLRHNLPSAVSLWNEPREVPASIGLTLPFQREEKETKARIGSKQVPT